MRQGSPPGKSFRKTYLFVCAFLRKTCRFWPPDNVFWWFQRALEFSGRRMIPNEYEITSKSKFWTRNVRNWTKSLVSGFQVYISDIYFRFKFQIYIWGFYISCFYFQFSFCCFWRLVSVSWGWGNHWPGTGGTLGGRPQYSALSDL